MFDTNIKNVIGSNLSLSPPPSQSKWRECMYVYDLIQIAEFLVWILQREGMECREERFAYLLTLSVVQHTNVQSNCPVLWD